MTADAPRAANVLRIFREATPDQVREGRDWFASARIVARDLSRQLPSSDADGGVERAAAVLAVLSPMTPWSRNVFLAREAYRLAADGCTLDEIAKRLPTMGANARKAAALVLGADPASVVTGPKVTPFWQRIADGASGNTGPSSVVIDRHAFDVSVGRVTDDATRGRVLGRKGGTASVQRVYAHAASVLRRTGEAPGITPAELQAVTWVVWRANHAHHMGRAESRRDAAARTADYMRSVAS